MVEVVRDVAGTGIDVDMVRGLREVIKRGIGPTRGVRTVAVEPYNPYEIRSEGEVGAIDRFSTPDTVAGVMTSSSSE